MAQYDVYIHKKTKKQIIVLHQYIQPLLIYGKWHSLPTTVDLLDVALGKVQNVSAKDFRTSVEKGHLILVPREQE